MKKILTLIFSILIFSTIFIFGILRNHDSNNSLQLSPQNYLYKDKYGESKSYDARDVSSETFITNIRVNETVGASEPKITCNPRDNNKLAIAANDFTIKENFARIFVSNDAGVNWIAKEIPLSGKFKRSTYSDPWIDYDSEGNLYFAAVQTDLINNGREGIYLSVSTDGGNTWKADFNFVDYNGKENIHLDRPKLYIEKGTTFTGMIYVTWEEVKGINSYIMFSKSSDRGNTFSPPAEIEKNNAEFSSVISDSKGELSLVYLKDERNISIRRSSDAGSNWGKTISTYSFDPSGTISEDQYIIKNFQGHGIRINSEPVTVISKTDDLLMTYSASGESSDRSDVFFTVLKKYSTEFTKPVRVHSDMTLTDQFLPTITADGSDNIYVLYQDSRNDPDNILTETYVSISTDGGVSFTDQKLSTKSFNPCQVSVDNYIGDYNSCIVSGSKLIGVWTDGRNNNLDLYAGILDINEFMKSMNR